jgi:hypothetical protein
MREKVDEKVIILKKQSSGRDRMKSCNMSIVCFNFPLTFMDPDLLNEKELFLDYYMSTRKRISKEEPSICVSFSPKSETDAAKSFLGCSSNTTCVSRPQ